VRAVPAAVTALLAALSTAQCLTLPFIQLLPSSFSGKQLAEQVLWDTAGGAALCGSAAPAVAAAAFFNTRSDRLVTAGRYSLLVWEVRAGRACPAAGLQLPGGRRMPAAGTAALQLGTAHLHASNQHLPPSEQTHPESGRCV